MGAWGEWSEDKMRAMFELAGLKIIRVWKLKHGYWPDYPEYAEVIARTPWFLVKTQFGLIEIGPRKRVISIDWSDTSLRVNVTEENVTKSTSMVHAYTVLKAIEYLKVLVDHESNLQLAS